jgi:hypothetical protein
MHGVQGYVAHEGAARPGMTLAPAVRMRAGVLSLVVIASMLGGCQRGSEPDPLARPSSSAPAAAVAPLRESASLMDRLIQLERELALALRGDFDDDAKTRLARAEAMTDRLLESDLPFQWLADDYDVEARLRQIQALADRVMARVRRNTSADEVRPEAMALYQEVVHLRGELAQPGRNAPTPLDTLLARSRRAASPRAPEPAQPSQAEPAAQPAPADSSAGD